MKPNQSIEIQFVNSNGEPLRLSNVVVELHCFTKGNFRYGFKVGRTDESGYLHVSYTDVEKMRQNNAKENLMDYNTKLDDCDPRVTVVIPTEQQLRQQYDNALRFYQAPPPWAKNWPSNAKVKTQEKSVELAQQTTRVEIPAQ